MREVEEKTDGNIIEQGLITFLARLISLEKGCRSE